jgi:cell volume regulation protein A
LRGGVSILLGILPIVAGLPNGQMLFNVAFIVVLTSLLVQGWSIRPMARWLGLIVPAPLGPLQRTELELPGGGGYEVVAYRVRSDSRVSKGERIPRWARPSLIVRGGSSLRPHSAGPLQADDQIFIVTNSRYVTLLDRLFAGPSDETSDPYLYGEFTLNPGARLADIADAYGATVDPVEARLSLKDFLRARLRGDIEVGDRVSLGAFDLIVRAVDQGHEILEVGLSVDPDRRAPAYRGKAILRSRTMLRRLFGRRDKRFDRRG